MPQVLTNNVSMAYVVETTPGVIPTAGPPVYKAIEPEVLNAFGATIATTPRQPISRQRDLREGIVTDLDSNLEFQADATWDLFDDFLEAFMFATMSNRDLIFFGAAAATATGDYTVPTMSAGTQAKLQFEAAGMASLVFARGYSNAANNGLKPLDAAVTATTISVGSLVDETPATSGNERLEIAGIRPATGDLAITSSSGQTFTLTSGNNGVIAPNTIDFTTLGLTVGQRIHIGGLTASEQFSAYVGSARIRTIAAAAITFDQATGTPADDTGAAETVDLLFGQFVGNVATNNASFLNRTFTFQAEFPDLFTGPLTGYQYSRGNQANTLALANALTTKVEATLGFISRDTDNPTSTASAGGANAFRNPQGTEGYGTASDFARLTLLGLAGSGDGTDFKSLDVTINNNVSPEKVLNTLGARFVNFGNFVIDISSQLVFTDPDIINAIRGNVTVSLEWGYRNSDGEIYFDVPSMKLGGGDREYPVNESVLVNWTGQTFLDPFFNRSMGVSMIPITPDTNS